MLGYIHPKHKDAQIFWKPSKPCWYSLESSCCLSTLRWVPICQGFSHLSAFLYYIELGKLVTSSIKVKIITIFIGLLYFNCSLLKFDLIHKTAIFFTWFTYLLHTWKLFEEGGSEKCHSNHRQIIQEHLSSFRISFQILNKYIDNITSMHTCIHRYQMEII